MCIVLLASRKHDCVLISYWISVLLNISLSYWLDISLMIYTEQLVLLNISLSYFIGVLSNYLYWTFHCLIDHTSVIEHFTVLLNFNVLMTIVLFNISLSGNANGTFIFVYLREILVVTSLRQARIWNLAASLRKLVFGTLRQACDKLVFGTLRQACFIGCCKLVQACRKVPNTSLLQACNICLPQACEKGLPFWFGHCHIS